MTRRRSLRPAPATTLAPAQALRACAEQMPAELVTEVLEYLDQDDLWCAAAVSRTFYASAWRAGLYIHRIIRSHANIANLHRVLQHVLDHDLRLSLRFANFFCVKWDAPIEVAMALEVLSIVTKASPVLVSLTLCLDRPEFFGLIDAALSHPAPFLQNLELGNFSDPPKSRYVVPGNLFSGFAPRLRRITLGNVFLGPDCLSVFFRITDCALDYRHLFPDTNFSRQFPCLTILRLFFIPDMAQISPRPPCFNLDGISLRKLVLYDWHDDDSLVPSIGRTLDLCSIPTIEYEAIDVVWTDPMWRLKTDDLLSIRLSMWSSDMNMHIVPENRDWLRICRFSEWSHGSQCPISGIPGIGSRLTYLRMDNICLTCFLECDGLSLDALLDLQIDFGSEERNSQATMLWPPDWHDEQDEQDGLEINWLSFDESEKSAPTFTEESYRHVHCPNLETLTLFALDAPTCVDSQEAAFLGRGLSQIPRPAKERATLALVGVEFGEPIAHKLLEQTFSRVGCFEFCGSDSPADIDEGLWDKDN